MLTRSIRRLNNRDVKILAKNNLPTKREAAANWIAKSKQYLINVYGELKKVHWPGRKQLVAYTGVVLFSVALIATIIWLFDTALSWLLESLISALT
ncbi:MAG: preprotein translocase subunit SecE [Syntrophomonadaceae bacterium]|nr:preprotein translocase subunit SecE [Syntrophomonadaceae bacterium]